MGSNKNKIKEKKEKTNQRKRNKEISVRVEELEEMIGKEKLTQFFLEHYLGKVKKDLPEPDFDIEDIMK